MLPIHFGLTRCASLGTALSLAGCMAGAPGAEELETQPEHAALGMDVAPSCSSDADCRIVPDYCADCSCVALGAQQQMPECLGEELSCVLNPCAEHSARCVEGRCSAESDSFR